MPFLTITGNTNNHWRQQLRNPLINAKRKLCLGVKAQSLRASMSQKIWSPLLNVLAMVIFFFFDWFLGESSLRIETVIMFIFPSRLKNWKILGRGYSSKACTACLKSGSPRQQMKTQQQEPGRVFNRVSESHLQSPRSCPWCQTFSSRGSRWKWIY